MDKCSGLNRPLNGLCQRYDRTATNVLQPPYTVKNGIFRCTMYWGESQNRILHTLEKIVGKRKPDAYCDTFCGKSDTCDRKDCSL